MADKIAFDLVSPERLLLSDQAEMVTVPGAEGYMGVMAGHSPVISTLRPGTISVQGAAQGDAKYFIRGGFVEISPSKITVLAEEALPMAEVDLADLDQRIRDAEEDVAAARTDAERARASEELDDLRQVRAAF
ncbi:MAG TPA: F0F1 ATP synthase subunit epsilon [Rhizomicrobium sp.]|jgi:F-type H+-transporting ATPase subunit epsilon|nr:F0F1 ATP synthase subunit epsilon [Rhizomicrobium sp.]